MQTLQKNTFKAYFDLLAPKYVEWDFYKDYLDKEPPFGEIGLLVAVRTYNRFIEELGRREKWCETILRNIEYSLSLDIVSSLSAKKKEAKKLFDMMFNLRGFPSGRSLWTAGTKQTLKDGSSGWNCTFKAINCLSAFSEIFYWLLIGAGTGFSVEEKYVSQLPYLNPNVNINHKLYEAVPAAVRKEATEIAWDYSYFYLTKEDLISDDLNFYNKLKNKVESNKVTIIVGDSKESWCNSLRAYLHLLTLSNITDIDFVYNNVRPEGERIRIFGGRASGPKALIDLFNNIDKIIKRCKGTIDSVAALDINNCIGLNVVSGGVRRTAEIGLGSVEDNAFIEAKLNLYTDPDKEEYRAIRSMSNNSVLLYENPGLNKIKEIMESIKSNGEPGFWIIGNSQKLAESPVAGTNPCAEAALDNDQSCNLTTTNQVTYVYWNEDTQQYEYNWELAKQDIELITRIGSRQTCATQWHPNWDSTQKRDRLLGVSMTGVQDAFDLLNWNTEQKEYFYKWVKSVAVNEANSYHDFMGINRSTRITLMKPEGCRPWNALTTTNKGILTLEELFKDHPLNQEWAELKGFEAIDSNKSNSITKTYVNGVKPVNKITLWFGHELESTNNHQWYVKEKRIRDKSGRTLRFEPIESWVRTDELQDGYVIETQPNIYSNNNDANLEALDSVDITMRKDGNIKQPSSITPEISWLLGYLWRIRFIDENLINLEKVQTILKTYFELNANINKCKNRNAYNLKIGSTLFWHWLIKNDIWKYYQDQSDLIPQIIRKSSKESIIAFIAGLLDSDGCVSGRNKQSKYTVYLSTAYDLFAQHLQEVALSVGLHFGRSLNTKGKNLQKRKHIWNMAMTSHTDKESFSLLQKHSNKLTLAKDKNPDLIWMFETTNRSLKKLGEVKKVEAIGEKETFDIEVENTHYYYAGAFKSHNTISQLPTVSSGIHRAYSPYYYRRIRFSKTDSLAKALLDAGLQAVPENNQGDDLYSDNCTTWVFTFPVKTNTKIRAIDEDAISQLENYKLAQVNYADRGHNISATITLNYDEYNKAANWINENWDDIIGVSFLPRFDPVEGGSAAYPLMPYEPTDKKGYEELKASIPHFKEDELLNLLTKYESSYEEKELSGECTTGCPIR